MLTGKTRYRLGWRNKLVLQVEDARMEAGGSGWIINPGRVNRWRDATVEDMQAIERGDIGARMPPPPGPKSPPPPPPPAGLSPREVKSGVL